MALERDDLPGRACDWQRHNSGWQYYILHSEAIVLGHQLHNLTVLTQIAQLVDDTIRAHPSNAPVQFKTRQIIFSLANSKGKRCF